MLETAMIFFVLSSWAQPFGAFAEASTFLSLGLLFLLLFVGLGIIGLIFSGPIERRVLHHA